MHHPLAGEAPGTGRDRQAYKDGEASRDSLGSPTDPVSNLAIHIHVESLRLLKFQIFPL